MRVTLSLILLFAPALLLRRDVADGLDFGEGRELLQRHAADDEAGRLRFQEQLEAESLQLREDFGRLLRQPDLNLRPARAHELRLFCARLRAGLLQALDHCRERRVQLLVYLLPPLLFGLGLRLRGLLRGRELRVLLATFQTRALPFEHAARIN